MRKLFWIATALLATLAPGVALAQHHGGGHSSGHSGYGGHGNYGGHGGMVVSSHGYRHAQPYYGNSYYADYPQYQARYHARDRHHDRHSRPRHHRRHH